MVNCCAWALAMAAAELAIRRGLNVGLGRYDKVAPFGGA